MNERTVSGNRIVLTPLDAEGNPTGEPIEFSDATFDLSFTDDDGYVMTPPNLADAKVEMQMSDVSPDLMRLLVGLTKWQWRRLLVAGWVARKIAGRVVHR